MENGIHSRGPRLLQVTTVPLMLEAFMLPYAAYFRGKGWVVHAAASEVTRSLRCCQAFQECHNISFSRRPWRNNPVKVCAEIRSLVRNHRFDVVHVHSPVAAFLVRLALRRRASRKPAVVYTAHGFHFHRHASGLAPAAYKFLEKLAAPWTDYLVVINREDYGFASSSFNIEKSRIRLLSGIGVDLSYYTRNRVAESERAAFRKSLSIGDKEKLLVTIGELNPGKRHQDAVKCMAKLNRSDVHLALVGTGPMEAKLRSLVKKLGLAARVHFLGYRLDIPVILCSSAALLFPSEREGLSRAVMEALALEVPVVGSNARGVLDLIDGRCGLVFQTGNIEQFATEVQNLLANEKLAVELVANGKQRVAEFNLAPVLEAYESLYKEALAQAEWNVPTVSG